MNLELVKEREMGLLSRKRITLTVENDGTTPSRLDLLKAIAKKFNADEELIVIKHIYPQFGKRKAKIIVHLYKDMAKKDMFEDKKILAKHKPKVEEKKEE